LSLREIVLIGIVAAACVLALIRPKYGLYAYIWYALMRPDVLAWVEDERNIYSMIIFGATAISSVRYLSNLQRLFQSFFSVTLLLLQVPIALSVIAAVNYELAAPRYSFFIKMFCALLLIPLLIETEKDLRDLILVMALSLGFVGIKYGLFGVIHGGVELARGYGPMLADNNFVALGLATIMPLCWYARALTPNKTVQWVLLAMFVFCIPGIIMTNSRGGIITLGVVLLYVFFRTRNKTLALLLMAGVVSGAIYLVQDMFVSRMSTLQNVEEEASAASRLHHLETAWRMWLDYPVFGVGFGGINYGFLASRYGESEIVAQHVAHNSYAQMLVDSGFAAFLLYVIPLLGSIWWLGASRKRMRTLFPGDAAREAIPTGLQGSMIAFALDSSFYSCQRIDLPYMLLLTVAVWQIVERQLRLQAISSPARAPVAFQPPLSPMPAPSPASLPSGFRNLGPAR